MKTLYRAHRLDEVPGQQGVLLNPYLNMARQPRDTSRDLHELADAWFEQQFGLRFRSRALFCSGNRTEAARYCDSKHVLISIEPIGDYAFCYSPLCPDMYEHFKRTGGHPWQEDKVWQELGSLRYQLIENAPWVAAAASGCEIMIFAQSFRYRHEAL
jgi:hypothetical protein